MDRRMNSDEHAADRTALVDAVLAAMNGAGLTEEARGRVGEVIGRIFDLSCEFDLNAQIAATALNRKGSTERFPDKLLVEFHFPDAEEIREEAHRAHLAHELKRERGN